MSGNEHRITRADVLKNVGTCELVDIFDTTIAGVRARMAAESAVPVVAAGPAGPKSEEDNWRPTTDETGDLIHTNGWQAQNSANLMRVSPRAFFLMAQAGLIPVSAANALTMIVTAGLEVDSPRPRVADVWHPDPNSVAVLFVKAQGRLSSRAARQVVRTAPPEVVRTTI